MTANSEVDILSRIIQPDLADMPEEAARVMLNWHFADKDLKRMKRLSKKANEGELNTEERKQLEGYLLLDNLLTIVKSKARRSLQRQQPAA